MELEHQVNSPREHSKVLLPPLSLEFDKKMVGNKRRKTTFHVVHHPNNSEKESPSNSLASSYMSSMHNDSQGDSNTQTGKNKEKESNIGDFGREVKKAKQRSFKKCKSKNSMIGYR